MEKIQKHLDLLGRNVVDRVTGYRGVVVSISFDLYGCIQAIVHHGMDKDEKLKESNWFDVNRLEVSNRKPVMERPDFVTGPAANGDNGPSEKPKYPKS